MSLNEISIHLYILISSLWGETKAPKKKSKFRWIHWPTNELYEGKEQFKASSINRVLISWLQRIIPYIYKKWTIGNVLKSWHPK